MIFRRLERRLTQFECVFSILAIAAEIGVGDALFVKRLLGRRELRGVDHRAARTLIAHLCEHLADDEQLSAVRFERQRAVVFEEHGTVGRDLGGKRVMGLEIGVLLFGSDGIPFDETKHIFDSLVERLHIERAVLERLQDDIAAVGGIAGHFEIEPCLQRSNAVVRCTPIGHDEAVKAPLFAEDVGEQPLVLRTESAVDGVVRAHEGRRFCLFYDTLERTKVDLARGALIADAVAGKAVILGIVERKVLEGNAHALRLHAFDFADTHLGSEKWIFGVILKIAAAQRIALDVDTGAEDNVHTVVPALGGNALPHLSGVFGIPARGDRGGRREGGRGFAHRDAVVPTRSLLPQAVGAVRHGESRDVQALDGSGVHEVLPRDEIRLFFGCKFLKQCFDIHIFFLIP